MRSAWLAICAVLVAILASTPAIADTPAWQTLPSPAPLPAFDVEGRVAHDGARIWFATFGAGPPVLLLHGGDASSDYWGGQVPALLASGRRVVVIDSRGIDTQAPWPKYQHDPRNTGNSATPLTDFACP